MLWSILICGIPERFSTSAHALLHDLLEKQKVAYRPDVELIYKLDNKRRSVGAKRNGLLRDALGDYICFVDDDDSVAPDYVQKVVSIIAKVRKGDPPTDVICFPQRAILKPSNVTHECTYSLQHFREREPADRRKLAQTSTPNTLAWTGPPAHTMVWRREVVKDVRFPEANFGEDASWVDQCCEGAKTEVVLTGEPLYFYNFDEAKTATR